MQDEYSILHGYGEVEGSRKVAVASKNYRSAASIS
jgi:hypothetical protein